MNSMSFAKKIVSKTSLDGQTEMPRKPRSTVMNSVVDKIDGGRVDLLVGLGYPSTIATFTMIKNHHNNV